MPIGKASIFRSLWREICNHGVEPSNGSTHYLVTPMNRFLVRSGGLNGWHYLGSLRSELCPVSKPCKMPRKVFNRRDAERLCTLRGRLLTSAFVSPKIEKQAVRFVLGGF